MFYKKIIFFFCLQASKEAWQQVAVAGSGGPRLPIWPSSLFSPVDPLA